MSSRNDILARARGQRIEGVPHPGDFDKGIVYDDPCGQFRSILEGVGGRLEILSSTAEVTQLLASIPEYADARARCSLVPGVGETNFDLDAIDDPHDLAHVDYAVLPGELAVAENAAIWVTTRDVRRRTLYFLTQHLALVVPRQQIVSNMHEAYQRIQSDRECFGTWISGPSKTADIEQSLVKGAHGARSLLVVMLDE